MHLPWQLIMMVFIRCCYLINVTAVCGRFLLSPQVFTTKNFTTFKHKVHKLPANETDVPAVLWVNSWQMLQSAPCPSQLHSFTFKSAFAFGAVLTGLSAALCLLLQHQERQEWKFMICPSSVFWVFAMNYYVVFICIRQCLNMELPSRLLRIL